MARIPPQTRKQKGASATAQQQISRWRRINMHPAERWLSSLGGGALTLYGLLRRDRSGWALAATGGVLTYRGMSGHSYLYQGFGIDTNQRELPPATSVPDQYGIKIEKAVTIERSPRELYQFWRHFENLPRIMEHLKEVRVIDETHSHWIVKAPAGKEVEWDAEIINDKENELVAWRSLPGGRIANAGSVHFTPAPGGRGTVVRVVLEYAPPAGRPGAFFAKIFGEEPELQMREDLRHFKQIMEAGEIPTTRGQPAGRRK